MWKTRQSWGSGGAGTQGLARSGLVFVSILTVCTWSLPAHGQSPDAAVRDAQTATRVRTALVNDPALGVLDIEVAVTAGRVELSGQVASEDEVERAVSLTRLVGGVVEVRSVLTVGPAARRDIVPSPRDAATIAEARDIVRPPDWERRRLVALGVSVGASVPGDDTLQSARRLGPTFRLGTGSGLGVSIGFGWFDASLAPGATGTPASADTIRVRPILAGVAYTARHERVAVTWSLLAGPAFNGVVRDGEIGTPPAGRRWLLDVDNSLAWRTGVSVWIDVSGRTAVNVSAHRVFTRPTVSFLNGGQVETQILNADTTLVAAALAWKLF